MTLSYSVSCAESWPFNDCPNLPATSVISNVQPLLHDPDHDGTIVRLFEILKSISSLNPDYIAKVWGKRCHQRHRSRCYACPSCVRCHPRSGA